MFQLMEQRVDNFLEVIVTLKQTEASLRLHSNLSEHLVQFQLRSVRYSLLFIP